MKRFYKFFLLLIVLAALVSSAYASDFTFKAVSTQPLYESYKADQWNFETRAQYINLLEEDYLYQVLVCTRYEEGREAYYHNYDKIGETKEDFVMEEANFRDKSEAVKKLYRI